MTLNRRSFLGRGALAAVAGFVGLKAVPSAEAKAAPAEPLKAASTSAAIDRVLITPAPSPTFNYGGGGGGGGSTAIGVTGTPVPATHGLTPAFQEALFTDFRERYNEWFFDATVPRFRDWYRAPPRSMLPPVRLRHATKHVTVRRTLRT